MVKNDDLFEKAFDTLKQEGLPTEQQKEVILDRILMECKTENTSVVEKIKQFIISYPWRFAFTASVIQAVVFTLIFGTRYTNLFLNIFGG